jgi:hypothetical protein
MLAAAVRRGLFAAYYSSRAAALAHGCLPKTSRVFCIRASRLEPLCRYIKLVAHTSLRSPYFPVRPQTMKTIGDNICSIRTSADGKGTHTSEAKSEATLTLKLKPALTVC